MGEKEAIFVSEDLPGSAVQPGLRGLLYRAYESLLSFALGTVLSNPLLRTAIIPQSLLDKRKAGSGSGPKLLSANYVVSNSWATVDLRPVVAFHKKLVERYCQLGTDLRPSMVEVLSTRVVLAGLLENIARPAEAYGRFFEGAGARSLLLLTGLSNSERIAAQVARDMGWTVSYSAWRWIFAPALLVKNRLQRHRDGLPGIEHTRAQFTSSAEPAASADLIFFCIDERRIRRMAETMNALADAGTSTCLAVHNVKREVARSLSDLKGKNLRVDSVNHFLPASGVPSVQEAFEKASRAWEKMFSADGLEGNYRGVSFEEHCRQSLQSSWAKHACETELFALAAARYLEERKPRLVVLSDVGLHSMIMARVCEELGIAAVFYVYNPVIFTVSFWTDLLLESVRARYVFAATKHMADVFEKQAGFARVKLRVVGDVFASKVLPQEVESARKKWREKIGVPATGKLVLALSFFVGADISESQKRRFLRCISEGVKKEGAHLIVKAHPNEDKNLLKRMLEEEGVAAAFVAQTESLRELLLASDAACMVYSQAGMEVVMMDIPLFIVQDEAMLQGYEDWVPYVREGAAVFVPDTADFGAALRPILFDPAASKARLEQAARFREKYITSSSFDPVEKMTGEVLSVLAETRAN